ncbi:MAG: lipid II:glycine glycyltransferase FemX [Candidatus Hodarchaeota archaeon]
MPEEVVNLQSSTIVEDPSQEKWTNFTQKLIEGNLEQDYEFGEAIAKAYPNFKLVRLLARQQEDSIGGLQGFYRSMFGIGRLIIIGGVSGFAPITTLKGNERNDVIVDLILALEKYAKKNRIIETQINWPEKWEMHKAFIELEFKPIRQYNVYTVGLQGSVDELWDNLASNKRKNIRKAVEKKIQIREAQTSEDFNFFYEMLDVTSKRAGFVPTPFHELHAIWEKYVIKDSARIFFAVHQGKDIAGVLTISSGDTVYAKAAASLEDFWELRPNDILHWKAMEWGCKEGFSKYHMGMVPEPVPTHGSPQWGLWRWKREWKGQLQKVFVYNRVYYPKIKKLISWAEGMKKRA